jgi:hypothetical protein
MQTGRDTGAPSTSTVDTLPAVRRIPVSADGVYAVGQIPACEIIRAWINTEVAWEGSAGNTSTLMIGTSADQDLYGSVVVSGLAVRDVLLSAGAQGLVSGAQIIVNVTTVGTAGVGSGSFFVMYLQAQD